MMNYYVTLPSNGSDLTSEWGKRNNTKSDFETELKMPLSLEYKKYEVGLTEFSYRRSWKINLGHFKLINYESKTILFDDNIYVLDGISIMSASYLMVSYFKNRVTLSFTQLGQLKIVIGSSLSLEINGYFASLILDDTGVAKENGDTSTFHKIDHLTLKGTNTFIITSNSINVVQEIYIYTNIIDEVHVGSEMLKLLRVVTVTGKVEENTSVIFILPHYLSLDSSYIDRIRMFICDSQGNKINFIDSHSQVLYKLHFKLKHLV